MHMNKRSSPAASGVDETMRIAQSPVALDDCGMAAAAHLLGDRWILLILRSALYGVSRFEDLQRELSISRGVLSAKLSALVDAGLLERKAYREEGARARTQYVPSAAARELVIVFAALMQWGDKWVRREPAALNFVDKESGAPLKVSFVTPGGRAVALERVTAKQE